MIRHSSSFLFSIIIHIALLFSLLFIYNVYIKKKEVQCEKKVCVKLCNLERKKESVIPTPKSKAKPKLKEKPKVKKIQKKKMESKTVKKEKTREIDIKKQKIKTIVPIPALVEVDKTDNIKEKEPEKKPLVQKIEQAKIIKEVTKVPPSAEELSREYLNDNIAEIIKLLQDNLYYPRIARKKSITGKVMVKFTISLNAEVSNINILNYEHKILSRAAIKTIENLSGKFPKPKEELSLQVPINYILD